MDDDPAWRRLDPGELVHIGADLSITISSPFRAVPAHLLQRADLEPGVATSQHPEGAGPGTAGPPAASTGSGSPGT
jgi:hypothetical protein